MVLIVNALAKTPSPSTYHLSDAISDTVYNVPANGVVAKGIIVSCILFAID